jgi:hypothetical protein
MKHLPTMTLVHLINIFFILTPPNCAVAQEQKTNSLLAEKPCSSGGNLLEGTNTEVETSIALDQSRGAKSGVMVFFNQQKLFYPNMVSLDTNTYDEVVKHLRKEDWMYFLAPNSFCGPIELRDNNGLVVRLLKPALSDQTNYPKSYSLRLEAAKFRKQHMVYSGPPFPIPLMTPVAGVTSFHLKDYFDIKLPGQYKLTVWPKVYRRSITNEDLCDRIDLKPVTIQVPFDF